MGLGKVWHRAGNDGWYVLIDGKQRLLAKGKDNRAVAELAHAQLVVAQHEVTQGGADQSDATPCKVVLRAWLAYNQPRIHKTTAERARYYVESFVRLHGEVSTRDLRLCHFDAWLATQPGWGDNCVYTAIAQLSAAWNWGIRREFVTRNPTRAVERPKPKSRGKEAVITEEEYLTILWHAKPYMRVILQGLMETGCRPSELLTVTAGQYVAKVKCWELLHHKTADKVGPRLAVLTNLMVEVTEQQIALYPSGPLFRDEKGTALTARRLCDRLHAVAKLAGISRTITPYYFRHTFVHDLLMDDLSSDKVAALVGHTSTRYVSKNYGHLLQRAAALQGDLEAARGHRVA